MYGDVGRAWKIARDTNLASAFEDAASAGDRLLVSIEDAGKTLHRASSDLGDLFGSVRDEAKPIQAALDEAADRVAPVVARCRKLAG
ncbi:MAG: hypothetical protein ACRDRL_03970 [Sciscionella sp.]